jgi:phytoene desaturase
MSTPKPKRAIVIGSGFGGLAAAMRLLAAGLDVTVVERLPAPGGRASQIKDQGYTWDLGPSLVTMPWCFDELFALLDRDFRQEVELVALDPFYRIDWPHDGTRIDFVGDVPAMQEELAKLSPHDAANYPRERGARGRTQGVRESAAVREAAADDAASRRGAQPVALLRQVLRRAAHLPVDEFPLALHRWRSVPRARRLRRPRLSAGR